MTRMHKLMEWLDWYDVPPTRLWRWLLKRLDDKYEVRKQDYDY